MTEHSNHRWEDRGMPPRSPPRGTPRHGSSPDRHVDRLAELLRALVTGPLADDLLALVRGDRRLVFRPCDDLVGGYTASIEDHPVDP